MKNRYYRYFSKKNFGLIKNVLYDLLNKILGFSPSKICCLKSSEEIKKQNEYKGSEEMTKEQFELYKKIENEIEDIKKFLFWCGKRHHVEYVPKFRFDFLAKGKELFLHMNSSLSKSEENTFNIPIELQERIIEVVENYLDEKEEELRKI